MLVANPNPETLKDSRSGFVNRFDLLHRAPLEAFALAS
jgi:hypothetical protein